MPFTVGVVDSGRRKSLSRKAKPGCDPVREPWPRGEGVQAAERQEQHRLPRPGPQQEAQGDADTRAPVHRGLTATWPRARPGTRTAVPRLVGATPQTFHTEAGKKMLVACWGSSQPNPPAARKLRPLVLPHEDATALSHHRALWARLGPAALPHLVLRGAGHGQRSCRHIPCKA